MKAKRNSSKREKKSNWEKLKLILEIVFVIIIGGIITIVTGVFNIKNLFSSKASMKIDIINASYDSVGNDLYFPSKSDLSYTVIYNENDIVISPERKDFIQKNGDSMKVYNYSRSSEVPGKEEYIIRASGDSIKYFKIDKIFETPSNDINYNLDYPIFDFKITNNSSKTLLFNRASIIVNNSRSDQNSYLFAVSDFKSFGFLDEGWSTIKELKVFYRLRNPHGVIMNTGYIVKNIESKNISYRPQTQIYLGEDLHLIKVNENKICDSLYFFEKAIKRKKSVSEISELTNSNIFDNFINYYGVYKNDLINEIKASLIQKISFEQKKAKIIDLLQEINFSEDGYVINKHLISDKIISDTIYFRTPVHRYTFCGVVGPEMITTKTYRKPIFLFSDSTNYHIDYPISQIVKEKESDRFSIKIGAKKSTYHQFKIRLYYNNDKEYLESKIIKLHLIWFRSNENYRRRISKEE